VAVAVIIANVKGSIFGDQENDSKNLVWFFHVSIKIDSENK
jgi:hypothetical protein